MAHAVFVQNPESIYADRPGEAYHFPRQYLGMVEEAAGDWVVFYEGRRGAFGYVAVQRVERVIADPAREGMYFALLDPGSAWQFETVVARAGPGGEAYERALRGTDGRPISGGANTAAVRRLSEAEFAAIVDAGLTAAEGADALPRAPGFAEAPAGYGPAPLAEDRRLILASRPARDASFERQVKRAYRGRCAISGLSLRNGGGRPEVQAAHIRPAARGGPDIVRNGLALSGTLHWMFDRGLIAVGDDLRILVSQNKVPVETARRLINPGQRLMLPEDPRDHPHPDYLRFHREHVFGGP